MSTKKKPASKKKTSSPKKRPPVSVKSSKQERQVGPVSPFARAWHWRKNLTPRTPHSSFRRTYRRDYARSLELPGYVPFTINVWQTLWQHKSLFGGLVTVYGLLSALLVGVASQATYSQLSELIRSTSGEIFEGNIGQIGEAGSLLLVGISGGLNPNLGEAQQLISGLLVLLAWLTTVWLLRALLAGHKPRLVDGLYNSGAPIVPTLLLSFLLILQLVPAAFAAIGISAAMPTGLVNQGVEAMLFWVVVLLLLLLSLYWVTSTLIALVVVTLPGMYPLRALRTAHELVVGRRLRVVIRMIWLLAVTLASWVIIMLPVILFDTWIKGVWPAIVGLPIVPFVLLLMSSASVVWAASYIYLLYRKVVDDDSAPA